jgi:hypothetical protein
MDEKVWKVVSICGSQLGLTAWRGAAKHYAPASDPEEEPLEEETE